MSPMTMLWASILLLIVFAAIRGARKIDLLRRSSSYHPYKAQMSLRVPEAHEISPQRGTASTPGRVQGQAVTADDRMGATA